MVVSLYSSSLSSIVLSFVLSIMFSFNMRLTTSLAVCIVLDAIEVGSIFNCSKRKLLAVLPHLFIVVVQWVSFLAVFLLTSGPLGRSLSLMSASV